jgi:hypothetical protein
MIIDKTTDESKLLTSLLSYMVKKGYIIKSKMNEMNIVGIRTWNKEVSNKFDDHICYFSKNGFTEDDKYNFKFTIISASTKPGKPYLLNPINSKGSAILKAGQYVDCWSLGLHKGKYPALVQVKPVTVYRDNNYDNLFDLNESKLDTGMFGINIHRASSWRILPWVDKNSAGCQVIQNPDDYNNFILQCDKHILFYGNKFTYTLINADELE